MQKRLFTSLLSISLWASLLATFVLYQIQTFITQKAADQTSVSRIQEAAKRLTLNEIYRQYLIDQHVENCLALARSLAVMIELMGGALKVESAPGIGSKFSFSLAFAAVEKTGDTIAGEKEPTVVFNDRPAFSGEVLVCEDNLINQELIRENLTKVGLKTTIASNGRVGVDLARDRMRRGKPFDLIFMDINMPVMDGLEAAKRLAEIGNRAPLVALTANAMFNDRESYLAQGMSDYLSKPFEIEERMEAEHE